MFAKAFTTACLLSTVLAASAAAAPYTLKYNGTSVGTGLPFNTTLDLDIAASGAVASFIDGSRNGVAITGLSSYDVADNRINFSNPYGDFAGFAFVISGGEAFNLYYSNQSYFEANSVSNTTNLVSSLDSPVSTVSLAPTVAGAVPEPATWGMMILGFGVAGAALRRRRITTRLSHAG